MPTKLNEQKVYKLWKYNRGKKILKSQCIKTGSIQRKWYTVIQRGKKEYSHDENQGCLCYWFISNISRKLMSFHFWVVFDALI